MQRFAIISATSEAEILPILAIVEATSVPSAENQCDETQQCIAVADDVTDATHYIKAETGRANVRDASPCTPTRDTVPADGQTVVTLQYLRPGTQITIVGPDSDQFTAEADVELTFARAGTYRIRAEAPFPARPTERVIHAT